MLERACLLGVDDADGTAEGSSGDAVSEGSAVVIAVVAALTGGAAVASVAASSASIALARISGIASARRLAEDGAAVERRRVANHGRRPIALHPARGHATSLLMRALVLAGLIVVPAACSSRQEIQPDSVEVARHTTREVPRVTKQGGNPTPCTGANGEPGHTAADNTCCTEGCLDGQLACHAVTRIDSLDYSTDPGMCGHQGGACASCDDGNQCTDDVCAEDGCSHFKWDHLKACTVGAASGFCRLSDTKCCTSNADLSCCKGYLWTPQSDECVAQCHTSNPTTCPAPPSLPAVKCVNQCPTEMHHHVPTQLTPDSLTGACYLSPLNAPCPPCGC